MTRARLSGVLLGTAVGDALGLPREGLSPARATRLFGDTVDHALVAGRGLISDDTDHACMVVQAWLAARGDEDAFARSLAARLRWWFAALPPGIGWGTARALVKSWCGLPPSRSGVWTAGNGPAMRCGALGLLVDGDDARLRAWVRAATYLTHTDPRAERAAFLVALAVRHAAADRPRSAFLGRARAALPDADEELGELLAAIEDALGDGVDIAAFARRIGGPARASGPAGDSGVTGYAYRTVPVALFAWLRAGDFPSAVSGAIRCGGDADTVGAITGAIAGAQWGGESIPIAWLDGIVERPRSIAWIRRLAARAVEGGAPLPLAWWLVPARNAIQLAIVVVHGLRRLAPPYA